MSKLYKQKNKCIVSLYKPVSLLSSYSRISSHNSSSLESRCPAWISSASFLSFLLKQHYINQCHWCSLRCNFVVFWGGGFKTVMWKLAAMLVYLCFSCVSLINFFSSSILSAVSLRTITSSTVSTTSPFSPRFRLIATNASSVKDIAFWHLLLMHVSNSIKLCNLF